MIIVFKISLMFYHLFQFYRVFGSVKLTLVALTIMLLLLLFISGCCCSQHGIFCCCQLVVVVAKWLLSSGCGCCQVVVVVVDVKAHDQSKIVGAYAQ